MDKGEEGCPGPTRGSCVCSLPRGALIADRFHILLMDIICCLYASWSAVGYIHRKLI